ncbi:MAG TPA: DNA polymerase IV [Bacteroidales bacterium]|nr:DNA polymerase IV [Bacteroidales bacterium]HPF02452.1 DNA polymerase IV [Bacteroidales bacterium]HPJ58966.1 DNA polymerase IV [Bacteroidales bacterium]HPR12032.1 DNA polymerase IV [Bacteroidales bacterium]HRW86289.1 DNA polymerase IV [Bacteroidales bacterium]
MDYDRSILHLDLDTFFVSVERLKNSRLSGKPVIIGGFSDRGVVASCSYEARRYGVSSAMPMKMARMMCPEAIVIRGDHEAYSNYSRMVTEIIAERAPLYEKSSIDEHYIDMTGMDRFYGCFKWSHELREYIIKETGLPISTGLSVNKTVSKIATGEAKPNGEKEVTKELVLPFLDPLSISRIPMIGQKTYHVLRSMGIATIYTLRNIPVEMLEKVMGKNGIEVWKRANGIDSTPVISYSEQKSISTEHTFDTDTTDMVKLNQLLVSMVERIAYDLRKQEKLCSCVTVKIRYSNFDTHTLQKKIPYTAFDHVLTGVAQELLSRLYQRRMLIRLIGVRFSGLVRGVQQLDMFDDTPEKVSLYMAIDRLRKRFGKDAVRRAAGVMTNAERQEKVRKQLENTLKEQEMMEQRLKGYHMYGAGH